MCTVIIDVPEVADGPVRLLAIRDEDPARSWREPGAWWPDAYPGVSGIADDRAGGAWLAYRDAGASSALAVLLNRVEVIPPRDPVTRGGVPLRSVTDLGLGELSRLRGFNLVEVRRGSARVRGWDGAVLEDTDLTAGTHMIAHDRVDDAATARIDHWLQRFRETSSADGNWRERWLGVVADSAELHPGDERALIRDQQYQGVRSASLLLCFAEVRADGIDLDYRPLVQPGRLPVPGPA